MKSRLFILALDGVPQSHLQNWLNLGWMPALKKWLNTHKIILHAMNSVTPPVSSTAWASFMTGQKPQEHGIYSFTERDPSTMDWFTAKADRLKSPTIFEHASAHGKRVFTMNVPVTYPPKPLNGISICGFLHNDIRSGTWPEEIGTFLHNRGYRIDSDTSLAKHDLRRFLDDLKQVLEKRIETLWYFWQQEKWDLFMAHIMAPDRLHHFTFEWYEQGRPEIAALYKSFYGRLDRLVEEIVNRLPQDCALMLLSDHGFTTLKQEVYLNRWLWEKGWLRFTRPVPQSLHDIHPASKAYALYPGRIFINLQGREKNGTVPQSQYETIGNEIATALGGFHYNDKRIVASVKNAAQVYDGLQTPHREIADLFVLAEKGFDIKGSLWHSSVFDKTVFNGMHSFDNAFCAAQQMVIPKAPLAVNELAAHICHFLDIPVLTRH